jgi:hypothetical protein
MSVGSPRVCPEKWFSLSTGTNAIDASEEERRRLHRAAALDAGFKIEPEPNRGTRRIWQPGKHLKAGQQNVQGKVPTSKKIKPIDPAK